MKESLAHTGHTMTGSNMTVTSIAGAAYCRLMPGDPA